MIGVDTNILVRFLTADDADQLALVKNLFSDAASRDERIHIDSFVLCELAWVLRSSFRLSRHQVFQGLQQIVEARLFEIEDRSLVQRALAAFQRGPGGFADHLIGERNRRAGCDSTVTFDHGLSSSPNFQVL